MILNEIYGAYKSGYQDLSADNSANSIEDLRKSRLTLGQINQLRRMNDARTFEKAKSIEKVQAMYGAAAPAAPGM